MSETHITIAQDAREIPGEAASLTRPAEATWRKCAMGFSAFLLIMVGYAVAFSYHFDDALTAGMELDGRLVQGPLSLVEFRHFVNHLWPFWALQLLHGLGSPISGIELLHYWDLLTVTCATMLLYVLVRDLVRDRFIALGSAFVYGTAHCVWLYAATGRLYSTSMLFAISAYYLAVQNRKPLARQVRRWIPVASAALMCFACYFWLVQVFNALGVGILLLLLPVEDAWWPRIRRSLVFAFTGIVLTAAIGVSCLMYVGVPLTHQGIHAWIAGSGTQPMKFGLHGLMAAAYGQADGILATPNLLYAVHGWMLRDPAMQSIASFPWQLAKFLLVWLLLGLAYIYPWIMFRRANGLQRSLIIALYAPVAVNMLFGLGWLGTDVQRFLPALISQVCLGAMSLQDWMSRTSRPHLLATSVACAAIFIAAVNLFEEELPDQRRYVVLAAQAEAVKPYVREEDLLITFGKDFDNPYSTTILYYTRASYLTLSNDALYYNWDSTEWRTAFESIWRKTTGQGGRVFVVDRLAWGKYPVEAAWSEKQHPHPTVREFAEFLQSNYCVTPGFHLGTTQYFNVQVAKPGCAPKSSNGNEQFAVTDRINLTTNR